MVIFNNEWRFGYCLGARWSEVIIECEGGIELLLQCSRAFHRSHAHLLLVIPAEIQVMYRFLVPFRSTTKRMGTLIDDCLL